MMTCEYKKIYPEDAAEMLTHNKNNRHISDKAVDKLARDMKNGRWLENGEPIIFEETGILKDGQHRLSAIVKANVPVRMLIVKGVAKGQADLYDAGRARTTSDILQLRGEKELGNTYICAVIKAIYEFDKGVKMTNLEAIDQILANRDCFEWIKENVMKGDTKETGGAVRPTASMAAAIAAAYRSGYPEDKLIRFAQVLLTGMTEEPSENTIIPLRNFYLSSRGTIGAVKSIRKVLYYMTQRALYNFERGIVVRIAKKNTKLYYRW